MTGSVSATLGSTSGIGLNDAMPRKDVPTDDKSQFANQTSVNGESRIDNQQKRIEELKRIDSLVRSHESAHATAAGGLAQGTSFNMTTGPDGKQYATGGEVRIDISPVSGNPLATIAKMQVVRRAALAPMYPSGQDRAVAAVAAAAEAQARTELAETSSPRQVKRRMSAGEQSSLISAAYRKPQMPTKSSFSAVV